MDADEVGDKVLGKFSALSQLVPVVLSLLLGVMWTVGHGHEAFTNHAVAVMAALGYVIVSLEEIVAFC
jgi:hypothetical protein